MVKECLLVDNDDQTSLIESLHRVGKSKGLDIHCEQFNVGHPEHDELLTENRIDIEKVIAQFKRQYRKNFNLAAFDWELGDDSIDGVELIRKFDADGLLKHTPKLLYSGVIDEILGKLLDDHKQGKSTKVPEKLKTLIRLNLKGYHDREGFESEIVALLTKTDENLDLIIEAELRKYPEIRFNDNFGSEGFRGKTLEEIATLLDSDDLLRNKFKKEIIQQVIAYLTQRI